jgi:flagellar hook assembly protein FlgD
VTTLLDDEHTKSGYHIVIWDGRNSAGRHVASGVYIVRMKTDNFAQSIKMLSIE